MTRVTPAPHVSAAGGCPLSLVQVPSSPLVWCLCLDTPNSPHAVPQLEQTRAIRVGCELAEAEIYLLARARFCTAYLLHKPCVQKRPCQEIWAEAVPLPTPGVHKACRFYPSR